MNSVMFKLLFPSLIRLLMGGATALLVAKGVDAGQAGDIVAQVTNIIISLVTAGGALAWSATEKTSAKPYIAGRLTESPTIDTEPMPETTGVYINNYRPPKGFFLGERSLKVLEKVDPKLQELFKTAIIDSPHDFVCYHGLRTAAEQEEMLKSGTSWVSRSKHQDGKAVDFGIWRAGTIDWNDLSAYREVACHMKEVADRMSIKIVWGGDWKKRDMVHIELA